MAVVRENLLKKHLQDVASSLVDPKNNAHQRDESNYINQISRPTNGRERGERKDLYIKDLVPYARHPFKQRPHEELVELADSIRERGLLNPVLVRPHPTEDGKYEIISGHNRVAAMRMVQGNSPEPAMIPATIRYVDDATADIMMTEANLLQRQNLLPSEKALAYKMRLDAMNKQGTRTDITSTQLGSKFHGSHGSEDTCGLTDDTSTQLGSKLRTNEELGEVVGESREQIRRYIRLTFLITQFAGMVDEGKLAFNPAVAASYLKPEEQKMLLDYMREHGVKPKLREMEELKRYSAANSITRSYLDDFFFGEKDQEPKKRKKVLEFENARIRSYIEGMYPGESENLSDEQIILRVDRLLSRMTEQRIGLRLRAKSELTKNNPAKPRSYEQSYERD